MLEVRIKDKAKTIYVRDVPHGGHFALNDEHCVLVRDYNRRSDNFVALRMSDMSLVIVSPDHVITPCTPDGEPIRREAAKVEFGSLPDGAICDWVGIVIIKSFSTGYANAVDLRGVGFRVYDGNPVTPLKQVSPLELEIDYGDRAE